MRADHHILMVSMATIFSMLMRPGFSAPHFRLAGGLKRRGTDIGAERSRVGFARILCGPSFGRSLIGSSRFVKSSVYCGAFPDSDVGEMEEAENGTGLILENKPVPCLTLSRFQRLNFRLERSGFRFKRPSVRLESARFRHESLSFRLESLNLRLENI